MQGLKRKRRRREGAFTSQRHDTSKREKLEPTKDIVIDHTAKRAETTLSSTSNSSSSNGQGSKAVQILRGLYVHVEPLRDVLKRHGVPLLPFSSTKDGPTPSAVAAAASVSAVPTDHLHLLDTVLVCQTPQFTTTSFGRIHHPTLPERLPEHGKQTTPDATLRFSREVRSNQHQVRHP